MPTGRDLQQQKAGDQLDAAAGHHQRTGVDGPLQDAHHPTEAGLMVARLGRMVLANIGPQGFFDQQPEHDMAHQNGKRKTGNHSQHIHTLLQTILIVTENDSRSRTMGVVLGGR